MEHYVHVGHLVLEWKHKIYSKKGTKSPFFLDFNIPINAPPFGDGAATQR